MEEQEEPGECIIFPEEATNIYPKNSNNISIALKEEGQCS